MSVDIVDENAKPADYNFSQMLTEGYGDISVAGFARQISVNVGETIEFCTDGAPSSIHIIRAGWYGWDGFRKVAQLTALAANQPEALVIPGSNGATSCSNWSVTASWTVPTDAVSGMYLAMVRNAANTNAFYITFVVRDDTAEVDVIYKTSDATWSAAYNHYGTKSNPLGGSNVYGKGSGVGNIMERSFAGSYHRPVITRGGVVQTYWWACELPLVRWMERNGFSVKYVTSVDLDENPSLLEKGKVFLSSGHDEYWTQNMRDNVESWRDNHGGHSIFMSGNEVFWKSRYEKVGDEHIMWCYKDTMPGPTGMTRAAGSTLDPVEWTGTWMDTRWPDHRDGALLTGTKFGMNGIYDYDAIIPQNPYGALEVWRGSALTDSTITLKNTLGFEADHLYPTQPDTSAKVLASYNRTAPGGLSDLNGEKYDVAGSIDWGIIAQRYSSGAVTVGFGTCQWAWTLDGAHDRGIGDLGVSQSAQQFTLNLYRALGCEPVTPQVTLSTLVVPATLQELAGIIPSSVVLDPPKLSPWSDFNDRRLSVYILREDGLYTN